MLWLAIVTIDADFDAHPTISHILNLHLQDNCVTRSAFLKVEQRLADTEKRLRELSKNVDKLGAKKS